MVSLNVYTPRLDDKRRAVMVYIHGGAFIMGGGASYFFGPNYLMEQVLYSIIMDPNISCYSCMLLSDLITWTMICAHGSNYIMEKVLN